MKRINLKPWFSVFCLSAGPSTFHWVFTHHNYWLSVGHEFLTALCAVCYIANGRGQWK